MFPIPPISVLILFVIVLLAGALGVVYAFSKRQTPTDPQTSAPTGTAPGTVPVPPVQEQPDDDLDGGDTNEKPETPEDETQDGVDDEPNPDITEKRAYLQSRFDHSTVMDITTGKDFQARLDFVMPNTNFPIGHLAPPQNLKPITKGGSLKICEAKWKDGTVDTDDSWKQTFERFSNGKFKWTSTKLAVLDMGKNKSDGTLQDVRDKCAAQGKADVTIIAYHLPLKRNFGGNGMAHMTTRSVRTQNHEGGHAIGLHHSSAVLKLPNNDALSTDKGQYNLLQEYGAPNCIMAMNYFDGDQPGFGAGSMYQLGWKPDGFIFVKHGETYKIRNQMNFGSALPVALCFRNFYTGTILFIEYAAKFDKHHKIKKSEFVHKDFDGTKFKTAFVLSELASQPYVLSFYTQKTFTTPHGWKFEITDISNDDATLKVTYDETLVTYKPARILVRSVPMDNGKLRVCVRLYDFSDGDDINNPPRCYKANNIILEDENGRVFSQIGERVLQKQPESLVPFGITNTNRKEVPNFVGAEKGKNGTFNGVGITKDVATKGEWSNRGALALYYDIDRLDNQQESITLKLILNKNQHCMVKLLKFYFE